MDILTFLMGACSHKIVLIKSERRCSRGRQWCIKEQIALLPSSNLRGVPKSYDAFYKCVANF